MIDRTHDLPVIRQCQILQLARSTAYYTLAPVAPADLALMRRIDELHLDYPFAGSRMLRDMLRQEGQAIGRKHVSTLMKKMGIEALYRKPNTSRRHAAHPIYPYLLRNLKIDRPNQVWATETTYILMRRGSVYLAAIVDWHSRRVLAWRRSNTLATNFCVDALQEAIARCGKPEIFNTDQGSQFTSAEFTGVFKENGIQISMDGKGRWRDNVFARPPRPAWAATTPAGPTRPLTARRPMRSTSPAYLRRNSRHEHRVTHRVVSLRSRPTFGCRYRG